MIEESESATTSTKERRIRIRLDPSSRTPVAEQVRARIAARIERGDLLAGERLPPIRALAVELDLAPNTVAKAYRELEAGGYAIGRGRLGTFVADRVPDPPSDVDARLAEAARAYVRRSRQLGVRPVESIRAVRREIDRA